jgi:glycosyltransferase involved in cell wall biosynthesis
MKVVHVLTSKKGGAGKAAVRIHQALLSNGIESSILSMDDLTFSFFEKYKMLATRIVNKIKKQFGYLPLEQEFYKKLPKIECEIATLPFTPFKQLMKNPLLKNADIIHLHWIANFVDYPTFFKDCNKPIVWTFHDMNPFYGIFHYEDDKNKNKNKIGILDEKIKLIKKNIYKNKIINAVAPSGWLQKKAQDSFMLEKVDVIHNPVPDHFLITKSKAELRQMFNINADAFVVFFISEDLNNKRKGFDLLVEALQHLNQENITLITVGKKSNIEFKGFNVINVGFLTSEMEIKDYYAVSDVFIIPSREDNLPNTMLESLAVGTPVVGFNIGGIAEHVISELTGELALSLTAESLSTAIRKVKTNYTRYSKHKIQDYALQNFNYSHIAQEYSKIYKQILECH